MDIKDRPFRGAADAPVTIVAYSDFTCPYCQQAAGTMEKVLKENQGKIKYVFKHFPLETTGVASLAAEYHVAAARQDPELAWKFYDLLFARRADVLKDGEPAIVNAANSGMTGCWAPLHYCIDNAIHTFAGVQLRAACAKAMAAQGHPEPTAQAKVTDGYNLPARRVIHTVGPIADGRPTDTHRRQLAECYRACLDAAAAAGLSSIAFCCISTGVFGFPQKEAASIAVASVRRWLNEHPDIPMTVVFNVFSETDESLYRPLLGL